MDEECRRKIDLGIKERNGNLYQPISSLLPPDVDLGPLGIQRTDSPQKLTYILANLEGNTVLDIGCSEGFFSCEVARQGYTVTAIDKTPAMVGMTEAFAALNDLKIDCRVCDWEDLFQEAVYYDNVLMLNVFHHTIYEIGDQAYEILKRLRGKAGRVFLEAGWELIHVPAMEGIERTGRALDMIVKEIYPCLQFRQIALLVRK